MTTTGASKGGGVVRLSKGFYLGSIIGGMVAGNILFWLGLVPIMLEAERFRPNWALVGFSFVILLIGLVLFVYAAVVSLVLVYKMWKAIQDGHARTTPGKAVGFLFIPIFGLYWVFQAFWGFAKDCNQYIARHNSSAPRLPEGLFLAFPILYLVSAIPYLGLLVGIANFIIFIIMVVNICDTVNSLPAPSAAAAPLPQAPPPPSA